MTQQLQQPIQFGKYTLFERLGRGGMADVYKARIQGPEGFERIFVVKRILPHLSGDPAFIRMFVEEAKLSARLSHPNIVQIFELGAVEDEYFISMEFVHGQDFSATVRALWKSVGPPDPALVAYVGRDVCRALGYAHNLTDENGRPLGMIHRDVSPSNVMLSYDGAVKLLDFGIAKALDEAPEANPYETTEIKSAGNRAAAGTKGTMKGKYAYMAPEQTEREDIDHRIDIFAAGIVLYEAVTGRRLFKGGNDIQTIERVRRCDVKPPSFLNPACPAQLDEILLRALTRDPNHRFQNASEMADALDDLVHAVRFTPQILASTLRRTFGVELGSGAASSSAGTAAGAVTGARVSRPTLSSTGSVSPTRSTSVPSPTIPPVVFSSRSSGARGANLGSSTDAQPDAALIGALLVKPLWTRLSFWAVVVVCGAGVGFAVVRGVLPTSLGRQSSSLSAVQLTPNAVARSTATAGTPKKPRVVPVLLQSYPEGAEIFVTGRLEKVGVTPMWFGLALDPGNPPRVMFRKVGFQDKAIAVEDAKPAVVELIANTNAATTAEHAPGAASASASASAPAAGVRERASMAGMPASKKGSVIRNVATGRGATSRVSKPASDAANGVHNIEPLPPAAAEPALIGKPADQAGTEQRVEPAERTDRAEPSGESNLNEASRNID